ncbi:protein-(glutamine-N5) methyltransferase, release factor-specific [Paramagnetospirillum marisnigri]|uniref:Release factor glutamine methyltransferase n=1 Tax=Paramagnetospirillum marisnigri TaxID=1285242 RepID=A0A178MJ51_9PROT|nr:peptide chain release factor N(5)-glutamine methyltransferase [Paramagnetospirillum marisnigri]OAN48085.1 protein-(glutamine-N5) methyltransferase, release factor-specific [Paramagnetospirillum marisnigri]
MTLTVGSALHRAAERLAAVGIDTARLDARLLLAEVVGLSPQALFSKPHLELTVGEIERFEGLMARREAREPVSHLLGRRGFWTLDLTVSAAVLDPRPDTETLVEAVLAMVPDRARPLRIVDFGTGSGCILLALLSELRFATGLGIDRSPAALAVAQANAHAAGLAERAEFRQGDWGEGLDGSFDVVVSNPPYIPEDEIDGLEPEVARFEPRLALAGGPDGLDCYRALAPHISRLLAADGVAALEVGMGQAADVAAILSGAGLVNQGVHRDLAGVERCVLAGSRKK